jgi:hypothetical protein
MPLVLRAATLADVDELLGLWQEAAENADRPPDTREAVTALLGRDPAAVSREVAPVSRSGSEPGFPGVRAG